MLFRSPPPSKETWQSIFFNEVKDKIDLHRIYFLGAIPYEAYVTLLQMSRVHVYLTYPFVMSWSAIEAMSCGALMVGSRTAPVEEFIQHKKNGLLVDFFNYDLKDVSFDGSLNSKNSIENKDYKSTSPLSKTVGEIQSGRGKVSESVNLKIQIIKRYNNNFAKNKTNQELKSANIKLDDVAKEQIGVVGPVTYNFIIRQAVYQWFKKNYLSNPNSFLYQSLPTLDNSWSSQPISSDLGYYIYVSSKGNPNDQPYPTIGVLFDDFNKISEKNIYEYKLENGGVLAVQYIYNVPNLIVKYSASLKDSKPNTEWFSTFEFNKEETQKKYVYTDSLKYIEIELPYDLKFNQTWKSVIEMDAEKRSEEHTSELQSH